MKGDKLLEEYLGEADLNIRKKFFGPIIFSSWRANIIFIRKAMEWAYEKGKKNG